MENQNEEEKIGIDRDKFGFGFDKNPPSAMVINLPLAKWAADEENGAALLFGKVREVEAKAFQVFRSLQDRNRKIGVLKPN